MDVQVDALGGCRKNDTARALYYREARNYWISSVETYKNFRFVVCFENTFRHGYWTEKMINAVLANAIPIYAGDTPEVGAHAAWHGLPAIHAAASCCMFGIAALLIAP